MTHFLIMYAPPLVVILAVGVLFAWGGRRVDERNSD